MREPEKPNETGFYAELVILAIRDSARLCSIGSSSITKDLETVSSRSSAEGMDFLTKVLPSFGKALDKSLSKDMPFGAVPGFASSAKCNGRPVFLKAFTSLIFDADGLVGTPEDTTLQVRAVRAVRQICYLLYKLEGSHSLDSEKSVLDGFVATDALLPGPEDELPLTDMTQRALDNAAMLFWYCLKGFDPLNILPGHGPGSVATGERNFQKMNFRRYYPKVDEVFGYTEMFYFNYSHLCDELESLENMEEASPEAKVVLVPKDSRGPRLISMEPLEIQWIQQGLMRELYTVLEAPSSPCHGYVNFTSQEINQGLALDNSLDPKFDTLDLKDASDRVSLWLIKKLLPQHLYLPFEASRSVATRLPDGHRVELKKFAPMGSAVCFPLEALTFWALAVGALKDIRCARDVEHLPSVYVFGDDLIVPSGSYETLTAIFEELYLKFNDDKCCTGRFFRESCGMDAFKGACVTPQRVKTRWSESLPPAALLSYVGYTNGLREKRLYETAEFLQNRITEIAGQVPSSRNRERVMLSFYRPDMNVGEIRADNLQRFRSRWNRDLHYTEVKVRIVTAPIHMLGEPGWSELLRCRPNGSSNPFGIAPERPRPCRYTETNRVKVRWKWIGLHNLTH